MSRNTPRWSTSCSRRSADFAIVFSLQELATPSELRPAPYDALVLCGPDRIIRLHREDVPPTEFSTRDVAGPLSAELGRAGAS